jgi:hypothetical protein
MNYYIYWMEWVLLATYVNVVVLTGGDSKDTRAKVIAR